MQPALPPSPRGRRSLLPWLCLAPIVAHAATRELWAPDEPRYAQVARELVERGDWLVLHLNGSLYPSKPPLVFWLAALGGSLAGWSELALRLPSLLATVGSAWLVARLARRFWGEREAGWGIALYLSTALCTWLGGRLALDPALAFFCLASVAFAIEAGSAGRREVPLLALAGLCAGLGALAKGPVAWLHLGLASAAVLALPRGARGGWSRSRPGWALFALLTVAPVAVWATAASLAEPTLWEPLFWGQHLGRVAEAHEHRRSFGYHLVNQPLELLPWTFLLLAAFARAWRARRAIAAGRAVEEHAPGDRPLVWLAAWIALSLVVFSAIPVKRELYLFPVYPAAALVAARELAIAQRRGSLSRWVCEPTLAVALLAAGAANATLALRRGHVGRWAAGLLAGFGAAAVTLGLALPPAANGLLSAREVAEVVAARPERPREIPCLGVQPEGYRFYGGVPAVRVETLDEVLAALEREGPRFLALMRGESFDSLPAELRARLVVHHASEVGSREVVVLGARPGG